MNSHSVWLYSIVASKGIRLYDISIYLELSYKTFSKKMKDPDRFTIREIKKMAELLDIEWEKLLEAPTEII